MNKNYNYVYAGTLVVLSILLIGAVIKKKKEQAKTKSQTPITDAINAIKTGQISVSQIPNKLN